MAWLAILLGMAMECILLVLSAGLGDLLGLGSIIADLAQNVSWSVLVCLGLSVGTAVRSARVPVMGLLGFLAAPAAFEISRVIHKGAIQALAISGSAGEDLSPFSACPHKGIGIRMPRAGARLGESAPVGRGGGPHGGRVRRGRGLWCITVIALLAASGPEVSATILPSRGVTQVLFPVGCSLVLFWRKR